MSGSKDKKLQAQLDSLNERIKTIESTNDTLQSENDRLQALVNDGTTAGSNVRMDREFIRQRAQAEALQRWEAARDELSCVGKKWCIVGETWLLPQTFSGVNLELLEVDPEELSPGEARFVDIALCCSPTSRAYLLEDRGQKAFSSALGKQRSHASGRIRNVCRQEIFGLEQGSDAANTAIGWNSAKKEWNRNAPILFDPGLPQTGENLADSVRLMKVCRAIIWGPKSIESGTPAVGHCVGAKWHLTKVTPGMIAHCACTARFALSGDKDFTSFGDKTSIPYEEDFFAYKDALEKLYAKRRGRELFAKWNRFVFPNSAHVRNLHPDESLDDALNDIEALSDAESDMDLDPVE